MGTSRPRATGCSLPSTLPCCIAPPPGTVRSLAGDCSPSGAGSVQGPFATARFNAPTCLVPSTSKPGMAFLCDTGNNAVRVIFMETGACVWGGGGG
jgi:hypothetical protein